uniref:Metallo-beta-lactamase domain-containing protein n=1 Tax=mine drainage metagenome TaxID=410659 RepID=E6PXC6_9ZZZZ
MSNLSGDLSQTPEFATPDHWQNGRFFNPGAPAHSFAQFLRWILHRERGAWRRWIESPHDVSSAGVPLERVYGAEMRLTFVNHATFLLQSEGLNIVTDPVWSQRVSPVSFAGPERHRAPGIAFDHLPPIDLIVLSHSHYDHLDLATLRRLNARFRPEICCPLGVGRMLRRAGFETIHELDWGQSKPWRGKRLHCVRAQHFSARTPFDRNRTLWSGWVVGFDAGPVYFAGDTGFGPFFPQIAQQFSPIRLALLPIGAYRPEWFMGPIHMTPEGAVEVHRILAPRVSVATHYGTFSLADDGETEPTERLSAVLAANPPGNPFLVLEHGVGKNIPMLDEADSAANIT